MACGGNSCFWIGRFLKIFLKTLPNASYQDGRKHLEAVSEEKIFRNRPIRNKNCLWRPCLLMDRDKMFLERFLEIDQLITQELPPQAILVSDRDEMSNLYRNPIDASYQVSIRLAKRFQKRRFLKISNIGIR